MTIEERFWSKVDVKGPDDCWEWKAYKSSFGQGRFCINYKMEVASRASYMLSVGIIPEGLLVLHKCDNSSCVNPNHLFLGTQLDNVQDMDKKNRSNRVGVKGEKNHWTKLTESDVIEARSLYEDGITQKSIADYIGVSRGCIQKMLNGKSWRHVD